MDCLCPRNKRFLRTFLILSICVFFYAQLTKTEEECVADDLEGHKCWVPFDKDPNLAPRDLQITEEKDYYWKGNILALYNLSYEQLTPFFEFKERQYRERQEKIIEKCKEIFKQYPIPTEKVLAKFCTVDYDEKHKLSYCPNAKVYYLNVYCIKY